MYLFTQQSASYSTFSRFKGQLLWQPNNDNCTNNDKNNLSVIEIPSFSLTNIHKSQDAFGSLTNTLKVLRYTKPVLAFGTERRY